MLAKIHEITIALSFTRKEVNLLNSGKNWLAELKRRFEACNYHPHVTECDDMEVYLSRRLPFVNDMFCVYFIFYAGHISESIIFDAVAEYLEELKK